MKKRLFTCITLTLILVTGCQREVKVAGTSWEIESKIENGIEQNSDQVKENYGNLTYIFEEDGTFMVDMEGAYTIEGTWTQQKDKIIIVYQEKESVLTVDGEKLRLEQQEEIFLLKEK